MDDYANQTEMDVRGIITELHEILTGPAILRLNVPAAGVLARDIQEQLEHYNVAMVGLKDVKRRDPFGKDLELVRLEYFRQQSVVEAYCSTELVRRLTGIVDALPDATDAKTIADQIQAITRCLNPPRKESATRAEPNRAQDTPRARTADANVADESGDPLQGSADRNPTPEAAPPGAARRSVDGTLVTALQALVVETMDRMIRAQQYLQHFGDSSYKALPGRDDRAEREMPKTARTPSGINNEPVP